MEANKAEYRSDLAVLMKEFEASNARNARFQLVSTIAAILAIGVVAGLVSGFISSSQ